jgi:hypothetical protein
MKLMRMTQTTAKYTKYDDKILEGTKSTETKQVLKDNAKQTRFWNLNKRNPNDLKFNI